MVLIAGGPEVTNLIDYTNFTYLDQIIANPAQGDQIGTCKVVIHDPTATNYLAEEDDFFLLDEQDPNGFPTLNLLVNGGLEPPYTSGIPNSWTNVSTVSTGVTLSNTSTNVLYGTTAWKIAYNNVASGGIIGISQGVILPVDGKNNPLLNLPYVFSGWQLYQQTAAVSGYATASITYRNASGSTISTDSYFPLIYSDQLNVWQRFFGIYTPPANTYSVLITLTFTMQTSTNSGAILFDGLQYERCTFARVANLAWPVPLLNGNMACHNSGGTVADAWHYNTNSGLTYSMVTTPTVHGQAQSLAINSPASYGAYGIRQSPLALTPYTVYTVTVKYQITAALIQNARVTMQLNLFDGSSTYLSNFALDGQLNEAPNFHYNTLSFVCGFGTSRPFPFTVASAELFVGIRTDYGTTTTGTVLFGEVTIGPSAGNQNAQGPLTTLAAGLYPTAFCDILQPGTNTDRGYSGLIYRQLRHFGGFVRHITENFLPERQITVDAADFSVMLQESPATLIIRAQQDSASIAQAVQYAQNQGYLLGIDYTTYVSSVMMVNAMTFSWNTTKEVLTKIANQTVSSYYIDSYKFLHYQPALAMSAAYKLSDAPDFITTFPMEGLELARDSTQSRSSPVFEGATQLSAPVTQTNQGMTTTLSVALAITTAYTSISVASTGYPVLAGTFLILGTGQTVQVTTLANAGSTAISISSFTTTSAYGIGTAVAVNGILVNNGSPVTQIDSLTIAGVGQTVGLAGRDTYAQGYATLLDPNAGILTFGTNLVNGATVLCTYRYSAPVIVRLHASAAEGRKGSLRRKIHSHQKEDTITSQQSAIDRANADLSQYQKSRKLGKVTVRSPYWPVATPIRPGQAISITHQTAKLSNTLFQVQTVTVRFLSQGAIVYECGIGFYQPDFLQQAMQARRDLPQQGTAITPNAVLLDVLSVQDGWVLSDAITSLVNNGAAWGGPSTWGGAYVWQ